MQAGAEDLCVRLGYSMEFLMQVSNPSLALTTNPFYNLTRLTVEERSPRYSMSQPFTLYRLQQIDSQLDAMNNRIREIETLLKDDSDLRLAQSAYEAAEKDLGKARKELIQAEENVRQQRIKIELNESTLYGGRLRNPKELSDLQNEVASLKRYRQVLEDRQLEAMLVEEAANAVFTSAQQTLEESRKSLAEKNQLLSNESDKLHKDCARFQDERAAVIRDIPAEDLALYDRLRQQRRGVAVSKVVNLACSACGTTLNSVLLHSARNPNQISRCDTCGRILYIG